MTEQKKANSNDFGYVFELKLDGTQTLRTEPHDTPEQLVVAHEQMTRYVAERKAASKRLEISSQKTPLNSVIQKAINGADDPTDAASVWLAFVALSESATPPKPLVHYIADEGVAYKTEELDDSGGSVIATLSKRSFLRRLNRPPKKTAKARKSPLTNAI